MKKDIKNYNENGNLHGYQELYSLLSTPNKLLYRGIVKNDIESGYIEWHGLLLTEYYIR
jgi:hypothetical protein